ncbi:hypothetical protein Tco_1000128, partial [Tanacetum coccineum]
VPVDSVTVEILCTAQFKVFGKRSSDIIGNQSKAFNHCVGMLTLSSMVVEDDVAVKRIEEIETDVLYNGWKRIYVTKYVQINGPPPKAYRGSWFVDGPFSSPTWSI